MANTFTLIASTTVGAGGAASFDFSSIPSTFTDLCVKISARTDNGDGAVVVWFNNDTTASNYRRIRLIGEGSGLSPSSSGASDSKWFFVDDSGRTASTFGNTDLYIVNYAGSSQKSVIVDSVTENNAAYAITGFFAGLWTNTAAINRVTLAAQTGNFVQYSTAYLYGINNS